MLRPISPAGGDVTSLTIFKDNRICTIAVGRTDTTILVKVINKSYRQ